MGLQEKISQLIKDEIEKDPQGVGYAKCTTDEEIQTLLNSGVTRTETNYITEQTPISRILNGVGFAPNICSVNDIASAKLIVAEPIITEEII